MSRPIEEVLPTPPFTTAHQLSNSLTRHLLGYPQILLQDLPRLWDFLYRELCSEDLDQVAERLWWMSKQDSGNISPLHRQIVKGRSIIVTEDPKLHLVWIHDRIFIKPLPRYLVSHAFWQYLYSNHNDQSRERRAWIRKASLGYLRTYTYLIRYESDFRIAQEPGLQLVPNDVTWEQFCNFAADLASICDDDVSPRYAYGELRLTRLNLYAPLLLHKSHFQRVNYQYGTYFARFYGPFLFLIGIGSVILSGLQLSVSARQSLLEEGQEFLSSFALWFGVTVILLFCMVFFSLCGLFVYKVAKEWMYAIRNRGRVSEQGKWSRDCV